MTVREALKDAQPGTLPPSLRDSAHFFLTSAPSGGKESSVLLVFGYAYASDPYELIVIGLDATGYPALLYRGDMDVIALIDVDKDGRAELVGRPSLAESIGECHTTYDPFAVLRFGAAPGAKLRYDEALSRSYNLAHYVWAGPKMSEEIEVDMCIPGKARLVKRP